MPEKSILNLEDALNRALGDAAFLKMLFDEFLQMLPDSIVTLKKAVEANDMDSLNKAAHQLKGAAANLGAVGLASACLALERIGKSGNPAGSLEAFVHFKSECQAFELELTRIDWSCL